MKHILIINVCLVSIFFCASIIAAENNNQIPTPERITNSPLKSPEINERERQQLKEDAKKLSEDFRVVFKDLSTISQRLAKALVDYIAEWIDTNYSQLSEEKKKILKQFQGKLNKDYSGLKDMSLQALGKILKEFQELLEQLEKEEPPQVEETSFENVRI